MRFMQIKNNLQFAAEPNFEMFIMTIIITVTTISIIDAKFGFLPLCDKLDDCCASEACP